MNNEMLTMLDDATRRLLATVEGLTDSDLAEPSLLPGWTRGYVLSHIARGAEALCNLLIWARTGVETPAYPSQQARDEAIAAGATRSVADQIADIARTAEEFRAEAPLLSPEAGEVSVNVLGGPPWPASLILPRRLTEVELHHTDLGCGYTRADWPAAFANLDLPDPMRGFRASR